MKLYDGEFFKDCVVIVFKTLNKSIYDVWISCNIDYSSLVIPRTNIITDINKYVKENSQLIGFNNQYFDNPILERILKGMRDPEEIYEFSQNLIKTKEKPNIRVSFQYLDLYKINHYDNPARATGLKKLEFNYRRKKIADLPFHHSERVTKLKQLEEIIRYCIEDVDTTQECYEKSIEGIKLRQLLTNIHSKTFPGINIMNMSDGAIGEELNLLYYCKESGDDYGFIKYNKPTYPDLKIKFSDCIPEIVEFKTEEFKELLRDLMETEVKSTKEFNKKLVFYGSVYSLGQGGLHTEDPPRIVRSTEDMILLDGDITGQYPTEIIKRKLHPRHLKDFWYKNAKERYLERMNIYKPNAKKDPEAAAMSDGIKAQLNIALYGKTNSEYSWQYDPLVTMKTTLGCQLTMLMLIEELELNGIHVISVNTDGLVAYFERNKLKLYHKILEEWKFKVGNTELGGFEFTEYEFIAQLSVNDYIAKSTNGDVKRKGSFMTYEDISKNNWHKDGSGLIIPMALEKHFIDGISVEDTINSCKNIYEFCYGAKKQKAAKKGEFKWLISEVENGMVKNYISEDRFLRYFIGGKNTINKLYEDWEIKNLPTKNNPVTLCQYIRNPNTEKFETLDRSFYINECKEILKQIYG